MDGYKGKRLLFLGTNAGTVDLVKYAKDQGAWVAVADYCSIDDSEGKRYADEAPLISTADTEALLEFCRNNSIDCVYAGISEFNLRQAIRLSEKLHLPFYCTKEQWEAIASKDSFRELCVDAGVPVPACYYVGSDANEAIKNVRSYPVMVKPVDGSASRGVFYCDSEEELAECFPKALEASMMQRALVEEHLDGVEFTAHYSIVNKTATLSSVDNRYPVAVHEGNVTTIPAARVYPSLFLDEYCELVDPHMKNLISNLGLDYGVVFIQGIYSPSLSRFGIFEGGLRSAGERPYKLISDVNNCNYSTMILDSMVLGGNADKWEDDASMSGKTCAVVSLVGRHGKVANVEGVETVSARIPQIIECEVRYPVGSMIPDTDTLRQLALRFFIVCDSREELVDIIKMINHLVRVVDADGNSLVVAMNAERVLGLE